MEWYGYVSGLRVRDETVGGKSRDGDFVGRGEGRNGLSNKMNTVMRMIISIL